MTDPVVTFCGWLDFADYQFDQTGARVRLDARRGTVLERDRAVRDWRPAVMWSEPIRVADAGLGLEDVGRRFAAGRAPALIAESPLDGERFDAWLMPVTSFEFCYLLLPAAEAA